VTPSFDPAQPGSGDGFFRPGEHILVVPQASTLAILDLDHGVMYATTPLGAESWRRLVSDERPPRRTVAEARCGPVDEEDRHIWARIAGYLLDRRIIEPVAD
jgi:hypothetical protein